MNHRIYGYVRVSNKYQNEDRQILAMQEVGISAEHIYIDKQSGKDFDRPAYLSLLSILTKGAVVYIKSIDRLGRNYNDIIEQWHLITKEKQADIVVLDMPLLDTRRGKDLLGTFLSDVVLQLLSFVAENERQYIRQRQAEGILAARQRGIQFGRPKIPLPDNFQSVCIRWRNKELSMREAARQCGLAESTFYDKAGSSKSEAG